MPDTPAATRQTIILAAGNGTRIQAGAPGVPKPLVRVGGRALIEHALQQAELAGCHSAVVVVGSQGDRIEQHLAQLATPLRLHVVHNPDFDLPNGVSLLAAEPWAEDRFFVQMADHVFLAPVLGLLDAAGPGAEEASRLLVDGAPQGLDEEDATKVQVRDGRIVAIGKAVSPWDAIDTGCFRLDHRVFTALRDAGRDGPPSLSAGMSRLAAAGLLAPVPLHGVAWADVDTPADRVRAEALHALVSDAAG